MSNFSIRGRGGRGRGGGRGGYNNGRGGFNGNNNNGSGAGFQGNNFGSGFDGQADGPVQVSMKGWEGGTQDSLFKFLDRKLSTPAQIMDSHIQNDIMYITVPNQIIAQNLLKLSGIRFAGNKLTLQVPNNPVKFGTMSTPGASAGSSSMDIKDKLVALVQTRADRQGVTLDLSNLVSDPIIVSMGADPLHSGKIYMAILTVASQMYPNIITINLANNALHSLKPVADLGFRFSKLRNLSLANNALSNFRELDCLSAKGSTDPLRELVELILEGNPMRDQELARVPDGSTYINEIHQRFPTVSMLDMNPVTPVAQPGSAPRNTGSTAAAKNKKLPFPTKPSFVENTEIEQLANGFIAGFIGLYDGNRADLGNVYDANAQFSLMVDTTHPTSASAQNDPRSQKRVELSAYLSISRNLERAKGATKRINTLICGNQAIVQALMKLPATRHPMQDAQKFSFEAWQTEIPTAGASQAAIVVNLHGEYEEPAAASTLSFDRMFVLIPTVPGSPAAMAGWPCAILHDQLTVRRYNGFENWQAGADQAVSATGASAAAGSAAAQFSGLVGEQLAMAQTLQAHSKMNAEWTLKCLAESNWNYQQALATFEQARAQLPPAAFQ
ncbi:nuclear mRNA export, poly(A)+RNA binding protein [Linderina macrospora]|uniref:Nuclear mRNA export, poly(A)+RNA binding protein n=1 Tax=Linderina macrospora TaxID=4868 RepID=A0ACC1JDG0_9FUNG|nr:nuclear mRNA export, poly(A)+RNA binding protein [Linderina macrospora]